MIYTVTLNASLDYIVSVKDFRLGYTNRTVTEQLVPGGKGINVTMLLQAMNIENKALGFIAGFVGEEIKRCFELKGCKQDFIVISEGVSRINVKLKSIEGTEINGQGPNIMEKDIQKLFLQLQTLNEKDILVLAGSIPSSVSSSIYQDIMKLLDSKNMTIVVDATGELLVNVLESRPFLIKPNICELEEIFQKKIDGREEIIKYAAILQKRGARNVLVSMAGEGALLLDEFGTIYELSAPEGTLINGVGAGDSMVAGFLAGWLEKREYEFAFKMGVAAGSASAFSEELATKEEIVTILNQIEREQNLKVGKLV